MAENAGGEKAALVLGIGNLLMGDEGVGVRVARLLEREGGLEGADVIDGGTGGFHLLGFFEQYPRIVIVDATVDGHPPGTVRTIEPRYAADYPPSLTAHDIGLKDMIEAAWLLDHRPRVTLVTTSVARIDAPAMELSPEVDAAVAEAARTVRALLAGEG